MQFVAHGVSLGSARQQAAPAGEGAARHDRLSLAAAHPSESLGVRSWASGSFEENDYYDGEIMLPPVHGSGVGARQPKRDRARALQPRRARAGVVGIRGRTGGVGSNQTMMILGLGGGTK